MKKNTSVNWLMSDASFAGISATKGLQRRSITLDELAKEVLPLLSHSAPNIIEEIQVFTDLDGRDLKGDMRLLRIPYYRLSQKSSVAKAQGRKLTNVAIRNFFLAPELSQ